MSAEWLRHLVNLKQSPETRRGKYWLCRSLGASSYHAIRMRDWRLSKIERRFELETTAGDEKYPTIPLTPEQVFASTILI